MTGSPKEGKIGGNKIGVNGESVGRAGHMAGITNTKGLLEKPYRNLII